MSSEDASAARRYHEETKHSELSLSRSGHYLDWNNKPSPFKQYNNLPSIRLPHNFPQPRQAALKAITSQASSQTPRPVDIDLLTEILYFSAGLTRRMKFAGESYYMRAASATGALYPIELYAISPGIQGLEPGVYHFNPLEFSLIRLREGDFSPELAKATANGTESSELVIALTSLAWRNSWKYQERSYRHWFWDSGVIATNLLATCNAENLHAELVMSFVDSDIDRLLALEQGREASVALVAVGEGAKSSRPPTPKTIQPLELPTQRLSGDDTDYPIIWDTNRASELHSEPEVKEWRRGLKEHNFPNRTAAPAFLLRRSTSESPSLAQVILRRGSTRRFAQRSISFDALSTVIDAASARIPLDFLHDDESLVEFYFIANDVEGLPSGSYYFDRATRSFQQLKAGQMRYVSGYLTLEQLLFSDASAVFFLMSDLNRVMHELGERGYRAAQFEAGVRAGKIYLASYALGIGASGSTFFDDAVTEFFSPSAENLSAMIAVGVGVPGYKSRSGKILPQFNLSDPSPSSSSTGENRSTR